MRSFGRSIGNDRCPRLGTSRSPVAAPSGTPSRLAACGANTSAASLPVSTMSQARGPARPAGLAATKTSSATPADDDLQPLVAATPDCVPAGHRSRRIDALGSDLRRRPRMPDYLSVLKVEPD